MQRKVTPKLLYVTEFHPPELSVSFQTRYRKGEEICRMLENLLSKDVFKKGVDLYFSDDSKNKPSGCYGYISVEELQGQKRLKYGHVKKFIDCMSQVSGKDLSQVLHWFDHHCTPNLDVTDTFDSETNTYTLRFHQHSNEDNGLRYFDNIPMIIPVKMGLVDGRDDSPVSFSLKDSKEEHKEMVLVVNKRHQEFHLRSERFLGRKPVPSLLRGFSAPVKLNFDYTDEELRCLAMHDSDIFNRWDACYKYIKRALLKLIREYQAAKVLPTISPELLELFQKMLTAPTRDFKILSLMMTLPAPAELADEMDVIDIDSICAIHDWVTMNIAETFKEQFLKIYRGELCGMETEESARSSADKSSLKNSALHYLMKVKVPDPALALHQFHESLPDNRMDALAALKTLCDLDCKESESAIQKFYNTFQNDVDAINEWFAVQASSQSKNTLVQVKKLVTHPNFDLRNEHCVNALLVTWTRNLHSFHHASGQGYKFLAEMILKGGDILLKAFKKWKRFDDSRQKLMRKVLQHLSYQKSGEPRCVNRSSRSSKILHGETPQKIPQGVYKSVAVYPFPSKMLQRVSFWGTARTIERLKSTLDSPTTAKLLVSDTNN
ncbi:MAG: DUF3458 domain-containing protein [Gammaproteobacteria bacterium]